MRRRETMALLAGVAVLMLPGCGLAGERLPDYRYRLTVEVDTPEGLRSGSSVIEVRTEMAGKFTLPDANTLAIEVTGEAVTVDLGKRGMLFALLRSEDFLGWAGGAMNLVTPRPPNIPGENRYAAWHARMIANQGLHVVPRNDPDKFHPASEPVPGPNDPPHDYPMLVRFRDIADPKSVERVDPDNVAASFGLGVKLRRITVQLTDDLVTVGIEKRLGWLPTVYETLRGADFHPDGVPVGDFQRLFTTKEFK